MIVDVTVWDLGKISNAVKEDALDNIAILVILNSFYIYYFSGGHYV